MDYRSLICLKVAEKQLDISSAALITQMSTVQLTQTIANLNREFGVQLFNKQDSCISLTEYGRILLPRAEKAFQSIRNAEQLISDTSDASNTLVKLNISTPFHNISRLIDDFKKKNPTISVAYSILDDSSILGSYDLEMRASEENQPHAANRINLAQEDFCVLVGKNHRLATKDSIPISDLYNEDAILASSEADITNLVHELFFEIGIKPKVRATLQTAREVMALVESGIGYCFGGSITWLACCDFDVVPLDIKDFHRNRNLFLTWPSGSYLSQGAWALTNYLIHTIRNSKFTF